VLLYFGQDMNLLDLIIVYFAFGAPFAVFQMTEKSGSSINLTLIIAVFLCWPVYAIKLLINRLKGGGVPWNVTRFEHLDRIRREIEDAAKFGPSPSALFNFRDIFQRFVGLVEAANAQ
jgi:hypothetical protein